jgi:hypothetical protein
MEKKKLSVKQKQSILLAMKGLSWVAISEQLNVSEQTLWVWRNSPEWIEEYNRCQELMFNEISQFGAELLANAFRSLYEIGQDKSVHPRDRTIALLGYIDRVKGNEVERNVSKLKKTVTQITEGLTGEEEDDATV